MFDAQEIVTGAKYAQSAALLLSAIVFIPLLFIFSRSEGYVEVSFALGGGLTLTGLAAFILSRHSRATILSIVPSSRRSR